MQILKTRFSIVRAPTIGANGRRRISRCGEVRQKFGAPGVSDEELVLRVIAGEAAVQAMLAAGAPREYLSATQPLNQINWRACETQRL